MSNSNTKKSKKVGTHIELPNNALDVICGMEVDPAQTKLHVEHKGEIYYFCNIVCKNHFVNDPQKYVG